MNELEELKPGEIPGIPVRTLEERDLDAIVRIDALHVGRSRREYFRKKVEAALRDTGVRVSLVAEQDGLVVGFLMGAVYYGEFGRSEASAVLDSIGVHPDFGRHGIGKALLEQLCKNLAALGVERLETQVEWSDWALTSFLAGHGFHPAPRLCLERNVR
ncbi:MAG: GNAT family N-acetyltransferase [Armatimonadetes bacterium]|nr:GNAT family N-acetyltransferase [Armatimonadota bacterium]